MDRLSVEKRSWLMSRVRSKDTTPELTVRRLLHRLGYRYRLHAAHLPGKPDLVFPARKKIIFVHGCFWHGHAGCKYARTPSSRIEFWREKIDRNRHRDQRNQRELSELGWDVLVVWQCQLKDSASVLRNLLSFLGPPGPHLPARHHNKKPPT
ncbi:very short patch repair endonuclease [Ralstonia pseudosolanacearum]|uniref:very short patch repair endonuclease n=1 Tax=Ralstonia pseudosolanacearum TaxID=1310165 RepID=UPI003397568F